jgi:aryl-alcohol dehydrogenase-like predicted oxidoreductase
MEFVHGPSTTRIGDLEVTRLGFGAMQLPGPRVWGEPRDPDRARAVLRTAVELGINLIDTSWYYGPLVANRLIAEVLHPYADDLVIASKLGGCRTPDGGWGIALRPDELRAGCDEDLRTLRRDRLDVVHLRWTRGAEVPFRESLDAMIALIDEGKIRHLALSNVTLAQLEDALTRVPVVAVQNLYNVAEGARQLEGSVQTVVADQERIVDLCAERGIAFLPFCSLAIPGRSRPTPAALDEIAARHGATVSQVAIAWLLARSPTMLPIPGTSSPAHLAENWAARTIALSVDDRAVIDALRA